MTNSNNTSMVKIHGQMVLAKTSNLTLDISLAINRLAPKGGVTNPMAKFKIIIIPK